jgi:7-cyano-7-deazaguanine synthase
MSGGESPEVFTNDLRGSDPEILILLSGGIDSTACLHFYLGLGRTPFGFFVDYGQSAAAREWQAVCDVASFYNISTTRHQWRGTA